MHSMWVFVPCADGVPIILRILQGKNFKGGPFQLGRWQLPVNLVAVAWVAVSLVRPSCYNNMNATARLLLNLSCCLPEPP